MGPAFFLEKAEVIRKHRLYAYVSWEGESPALPSTLMIQHVKRTLVCRPETGSLALVTACSCPCSLCARNCLSHVRAKSTLQRSSANMRQEDPGSCLSTTLKLAKRRRPYSVFGPGKHALLSRIPIQSRF